MAKAISYMKPNIDPNTRLYAPFNEDVGSVAKDYSQHGNHAQLTDVEWSNEGFNGAGKFNGSSSFGNCGNDASLNITNAITIEVLVKLNSKSGDMAIVADSVQPAKFLLWYKQSNDCFAAMIKDDGNVMYGIFDNPTSPSLNRWYHVVLRFDGTTLKLYIDSKEDNSVNAAITMRSLNGNVRIGKWAVGVERYFAGTIDEARIYNQAPNAAQIAADCYEVVCS